MTDLRVDVAGSRGGVHPESRDGVKDRSCEPVNERCEPVAKYTVGSSRPSCTMAH